MVNPTTVHKIKPSLNDMVYCANCGAGHDPRRSALLLP